MRRALFLLFAGSVLAAMTGCCHEKACANRPVRDFVGAGQGTCPNTPELCTGCDRGGDPQCPVCRGRGCQTCLERRGINPGPPTAGIAYPYYTTRGPRDFLAQNPMSIGP